VQDIVIVSAARTGVGKFGGSLSKLSATELGSLVVREVVTRSGLDPALVGEVIMGQVLAAGAGQNPARQALMKAGIPKEVPALTINAVCGSGLKAVMLAAQAVAWGDSEIVIAGGQENMSASPHILNNSRDGQRMGDWKMIDSMIVDGLWDVYNQYHMGITAENVAKAHGITRDMQDALALASQQKAAAAQAAGKFKDEIVPVLLPQKKGDPIVFASDEYINLKTNAEALAGLRPAFDKAGSVTAGNASGINDGAAAVMVMTAAKAKSLGFNLWRALRLLPPVAWTRPPWAWGRCRLRAKPWSVPAGKRRMWICSSSTKPLRLRPAPSIKPWTLTPCAST
jgi:acetyl-CoA C-acetyltransferase